jgi:hypothetical protein
MSGGNDDGRMIDPLERSVTDFHGVPVEDDQIKKQPKKVSARDDDPA